MPSAELLAIRATLEESSATLSLEPEQALPVPPYRRAFSASALNLFADCERKWYFRYLCNVVEDPGSSAATYGTAFHAALEHFHQRYPKPSSVERTELQRELEQDITRAFAQYRAQFASTIEAQLQERRAQRTAVRYIDWLVQRSRQAPFVVIGNETHAPLDLDGFSFTGFIDRLDREEAHDGVTVVDYKTGNIALSATAYRDEVNAFREFQLPFYYWSRTAAGDRVTRLTLIPLKDPLLEVAPIELEIVPGYAAPSGKAKRGGLGIAELTAARQRMVSLAQTMAVNTLSNFATTSDPEACTYCAYQFACRTRPLTTTDPFGR